MAASLLGDPQVEGRLQSCALESLGKRFKGSKAPRAQQVPLQVPPHPALRWEGASHLLSEFSVSLSTFLALRMWQQIPLGLEDSSPHRQVTEVGGCR